MISAKRWLCVTTIKIIGACCTSTSSRPICSAVDPTSAVVLGNHVSNEYWGLFSNGPLQILSPGGNVFAPSVTQPVGHA